MTILGGKRNPSSPVGPIELICECDHTWGDHDDLGCLFYLCECDQPGERK